jgi:hypothetical protein
LRQVSSLRLLGSSLAAPSPPRPISALCTLSALRLPTQEAGGAWRGHAGDQARCCWEWRMARRHVDTGACRCGRGTRARLTNVSPTNVEKVSTRILPLWAPLYRCYRCPAMKQIKS